MRLRALSEAPHAFSSSLASWQGAGDSEERWRCRLRNVPFNVIAEVDGRLVGQASGTVLDDDDSVELISMWVAPAARGTGVGDALVNEIARWAEEQGARTVRLAVRTDNAFAIRLYEPTGLASGWLGSEFAWIGPKKLPNHPLGV